MNVYKMYLKEEFSSNQIFSGTEFCKEFNGRYNKSSLFPPIKNIFLLLFSAAAN